MNVAVLGVGPARDLIGALDGLDGVTSLALLDADGAAARAAAGRCATPADATAVGPGDREALTVVLEGCTVLVDATGAGVAAMDAALGARCAYVGVAPADPTLHANAALDGAFEAAGLVAVVGVDPARAARAVELLGLGGLSDDLGMPLAGVRGAHDLPDLA